MATWNLVLVGHDNEASLQGAVQDFVTALESIGHSLDTATLTTDLGQFEVPRDQPPAVPTDTPPSL